MYFGWTFVFEFQVANTGTISQNAIIPIAILFADPLLIHVSSKKQHKILILSRN